MAPKAALRPFQIATLSSGTCSRARDRARTAVGDLDDLLEQCCDLGLRALDLDDQQRLDVERIAAHGRSPRRRGCGLVHELDRHRHDAGGDDAATQAPPRLRGVEPDQHRPRALRA